MSSPPVSLSRFRKARAKTAKRAQADANAVKFGRTKSERAADEANAAKLRKHIDQHKRNDPE